MFYAHGRGYGYLYRARACMIPAIPCPQTVKSKLLPFYWGSLDPNFFGEEEMYRRVQGWYGHRLSLVVIKKEKERAFHGINWTPNLQYFWWLSLLNQNHLHTLNWSWPFFVMWVPYGEACSLPFDKLLPPRFIKGLADVLAHSAVLLEFFFLNSLRNRQNSLKHSPLKIVFPILGKSWVLLHFY